MKRSYKDIIKIKFERNGGNTYSKIWTENDLLFQKMFIASE